MGHVYLVSKPSFSTDVVKVGKTTSLSSRMRSYGKDATWYRICMTDDCHTKEKELIKAFSKNFSLVEGNEYFRVPAVEDAIKIFDEFLSKKETKDDFMNPNPQEAASWF
nr:hypothetical protein [Marseillevirus cajuinensis]